MYVVDGADRIVQLSDVPQSSVGAPIPVVLGDERRVFVAYFVEHRDPSWDGTTVRVIGPESKDESIAIVDFSSCYAHFLGPPNDEAFSGHPLAAKGLKPYSAWRIDCSSWLRALERMNSVHPGHNPAAFADYKHFIWAFHDSTFECVAKSYRCAVHGDTNIPGAIEIIRQQLWGAD